mmetsp:Transcript_72508/g.115060  ORF Transcript_72508/g.115060 Transcript_72508/m.115060 type:complete len:202 (+) Transcript_72508:142-747(+)
MVRGVVQELTTSIHSSSKGFLLSQELWILQVWHAGATLDLLLTSHSKFRLTLRGLFPPGTAGGRWLRCRLWAIRPNCTRDAGCIRRHSKLFPNISILGLSGLGALGVHLQCCQFCIVGLFRGQFIDGPSMPILHQPADAQTCWLASGRLAAIRQPAATSALDPADLLLTGLWKQMSLPRNGVLLVHAAPKLFAHGSCRIPA